MRILHVNKFYPPHLGGVEFVVQEITKGLCHEVQIDVLVCNEKKGSASESQEEGVSIVRA